MENKNYLKGIIASGRTDVVIEKLITDFLEGKDNLKDLYHEVIMLSARYHALKRDNLTGVLTSSEANAQKARINVALLNLIDAIPDSPSKINAVFLLRNMRNLIQQDKTELAVKEVVKLTENSDKNIYNRAVLYESDLITTKSDLLYGKLPKDKSLDINQKFNLSLLEVTNELMKNLKDTEVNLDFLNDLLLTYEEELIKCKAIIKEAEIQNQNKGLDKYKLLFIYSNPDELNRLDFDAETRTITDNLRHSKNGMSFNLLPFMTAVKYNELRKMIEEGEPDFIHISAHGSENNELFFEDVNRFKRAVTIDQFISTLNFATKKFTRKVRCIIFSACYSELFAKRVVEEGFAEYSIGITDYIAEKAALAFTNGFYSYLFDGNGIEDAFDNGRYMIEMEHIKIRGYENVIWEQLPKIYSTK